MDIRSPGCWKANSHGRSQCGRNFCNWQKGLHVSAHRRFFVACVSLQGIEACSSGSKEYFFSWQNTEESAVKRTLIPKNKERHPVVFLDRDGVINVDRRDYVKSWAEFKFLPRVFEALRLLRKNNIRVVVVTNQSAVGRGLMSISTLREIHDKMLRAIEKRGGRIDGIYYCPHRPDEKCICRKPKPGMVLKARKDLKIDLTRSYLVGDSMKDVELARAVKVKCVRVSSRISAKQPPRHRQWKSAQPVSARALRAAVDHILRDLKRAGRP
jgi:D-glycero-D-manno-heptose 1,7-bisphosphate phosphatase